MLASHGVIVRESSSLYLYKEMSVDKAHSPGASVATSCGAGLEQAGALTVVGPGDRLYSRSLVSAGAGSRTLWARLRRTLRLDPATMLRA